MLKDEEIGLLIKEGYLASSAIGHGLNTLRKSGIHAQGEYYLAFFQLSIGLERLMKLIVIQYFRGTHNGFPGNKAMRSFGHNLVELYSAIYEFDTNDKSLLDDDISIKMLNFLSDFAMSTRYYNLDILTGKQQIKNPLVEWVDIENLIFERHFANKPPKSKISEDLSNFLNEKSYTLVYDEKNQLMRNAKEMIEKSERTEHVQGYSVYYIYQILHRLTDILDKTEGESDLFPFLREFFVLFSGTLSQREILKKKRWLNP